jgi:hypothetical protein
LIIAAGLAAASRSQRRDVLHMAGPTSMMCISGPALAAMSDGHM